MLARAGAGVAAAALVAVVAWRAGSLSRSGAVAATAVGGAAVAAGWAWGAILIAYFVSSSMLSRMGAGVKARRTASVVEKGDARDAVQVIANGGVFAALACASAGAPLAGVAAAGALAAAAADTWATETGTLLDAAPRSLRTLRRVPPGTSGGMSLPGTLALVAGALAVALLARLLGLTPAVLAVATGGVAGAMADSLLGVTLQERRWCAACERATERGVHDCGAETSRVGGIAWMDNDAVNFTATAVGAGVAAAVAATAAR